MHKVFDTNAHGQRTLQPFKIENMQVNLGDY